MEGRNCISSVITMAVKVLLLLLILGPRAGCKKLSIPCTTNEDPLPIPHEFYQPGNFIIGGIASQVFSFLDAPSFTVPPTQMLINEPMSMIKNYQHNLALAFAVKEINENTNILPNFTLGSHILSSYYTARTTYKATLSLLCAQQRFIPNFKCDAENKLITVIGGINTDISTNMATILATYKMPQLTYGSLSPAQDGKVLFPYLFQMVPNEVFQCMGVIRLLHHFRWTWIVLFALDDDSGDRFLHIMLPLLSENGICFDFIIRLPALTYLEGQAELLFKESFSHAIHYKSKANVVVVYAQPTSMHGLRIFLCAATFLELPSLHKVWITTSHWDFESFSFQRIWDIEIFHGALSFTVHANQPPGFQNFLQDINHEQGLQ